MNLKENSYKILRFACDKYGLPLHSISDEDVQNAYINLLKNMFIGYQPNSNLSNNEKIAQANKCKELFQKQLYGKDMQTQVELMELMVENNDYFDNKSYNFLKTAFNNINTEEKRQLYNKDIREAANLPLLEALGKYNIPISQIDADTKDISYGDLSYSNICLDILYFGKTLRVFAEDEYKCLKISEKEKISPIQRNASLTDSKMCRCSIMSRKDENDDEWISSQFYIDKETIERLKSSNADLQQREKLVKGIATALIDSVKKGTRYVGDIKDTDDGIICIKDDKMEEKVTQLDEKRTQGKETRRTMYNGESR